MRRMIDGVMYGDAKEMAALFVVSRGVLYKRMGEGMPYINVKRFHWFPIEQCKEWYANRHKDVLWRGGRLLVGQERMRKYLKITAAKMDEYIAEGMPFEDIGGERKYPLRRCTAWVKKMHGDDERPTGSLCYDCDHAMHASCRWIRFHQPVEGWEAKETLIRCTVGSKTGENGVCETQSYCVSKCPEFIPDRDHRRRGIG